MHFIKMISLISMQVDTLLYIHLVRKIINEWSCRIRQLLDDGEKPRIFKANCITCMSLDVKVAVTHGRSCFQAKLGLTLFAHYTSSPPGLRV